MATEKSLQVKRLAIRRQGVSEAILRDPPTIPERWTKDAADKYNTQWKEWARDTQNMVRGMLALKLDVPKEVDTTTVTNQVTDLSARLGALEARVGALPECPPIPPGVVLPDRIVTLPSEYVLPRPEMFGAQGDGVTDDTNAIQECITTFNACYLGRKTYMVSEPITVFHGTHIVGEDRTLTVIKLVDNAPVSSTREWFAIIESSTWGGTGMDDVLISNLTIDANYANQPIPRPTIHCAMVWGEATIYDNVKAIHFGTGSYAWECFALFCCNAIGQIGSRGAIISRCEVTDAGDMTGVTPGFSGTTCIATGGRSNPEYSVAPMIINNWIHDITTHATEMPMSLQGLSTGACKGALVTGNLVQKFYGTGFYVDTWYQEDTLITGNQFIEVKFGLWLVASASASFEKIYITNNVFRNAGTTIPYWTGGSYAHVQRMIALFGSPNFDDILIANNKVTGLVFYNPGAQIPEGILFAFTGLGATKITCINNVIDCSSSDFAAYWNTKSTFPRSEVCFAYNSSPNGVPAPLKVFEDDGITHWDWIRDDGRMIVDGTYGADNTIPGFDDLVLVDPFNPTVTLTLPLAANRSRPLYIKREAAWPATNEVVIAASGGETIDGAASYSLGDFYDAVCLIPNPSGKWHVSGSYKMDTGTSGASERVFMLMGA